MLQFQGAGLLGLYGCALLKEQGFAEVFCSEVNTKRLSMVEKFGGIPVGPGYSNTIQSESVDLVIEVSSKVFMLFYMNYLSPVYFKILT